LIRASSTKSKPLI